MWNSTVVCLPPWLVSCFVMVVSLPVAFVMAQAIADVNGEPIPLGCCASCRSVFWYAVVVILSWIVLVSGLFCRGEFAFGDEWVSGVLVSISTSVAISRSSMRSLGRCCFTYSRLTRVKVVSSVFSKSLARSAPGGVIRRPSGLLIMGWFLVCWVCSGVG